MLFGHNESDQRSARSKRYLKYSVYTSSKNGTFSFWQLCLVLTRTWWDVWVATFFGAKKSGFQPVIPFLICNPDFGQMGVCSPWHWLLLGVRPIQIANMLLQRSDIWKFCSIVIVIIGIGLWTYFLGMNITYLTKIGGFLETQYTLSEKTDNINMAS